MLLHRLFALVLVSTAGLAFFAHAAFSPQNDELSPAVRKCLELSKVGHCSNGPTGTIEEWDVSRVTDMNNMFSQKKSFNADISKWDVSRATRMDNMFAGAADFNADISKWNVARVTRMDNMFDTASSFKADISEWDVSRVNTMAFMFYNAKSFNSDISKWDVSQVTDMNNMFAFASSFKQELCSTVWIHSKAKKTAWFNGRKTDMFDGSSGSICKGLSL